MSSRSSTGGIFAVELWLPNECGGSNPPTSLEGSVQRVKVPIISSQSSYAERVEVDGALVKVEHTLTLVTQVEDRFWDSPSLRGAQSVGCVAEVVVSSFGKIIIGWSEALGCEQPLRLEQTTASSGESLNEACLKTWVFKAYSTTPLM